MAKAKRKRITLEEERDRRFVLAASSSRTNMRARMLQEAARDGIEESEQKRNLILKKMVSELRTLLPRGSTVADIGSGDGSLIKFVGACLDTAPPKAYDVVLPEENKLIRTSSKNMFDLYDESRPSPPATEEEENRNTSDWDDERAYSKEGGRSCGLPIHLFDGREVPEADESFDVVTCLFVLHHTGDAQEQLCKEMCRVSRRYVVVGEDSNEPRFHERNLMKSPTGRFRTVAEWNELWASLGLRVVFQGPCIPNWNGPQGPQVYFILEKESYARAAGEAAEAAATTTTTLPVTATEIPTATVTRVDPPSSPRTVAVSSED